ncbi:hypothetical protein PDJ95_27055 [Bacillus cereus]|nr:hypothetical protein [Bacillus cereus]
MVFGMYPLFAPEPNLFSKMPRFDIGQKPPSVPLGGFVLGF